MASLNEAKVAFICATASKSMGGGEVARAQWSQALLQQKIKVEWVIPTGVEEAYLGPKIEIPDGVSIKYLSTLPKPRRLLSPEGMAGFVEYLNTSNPDKIIFNGHSVVLSPLLATSIAMGLGERTTLIHHSDPKPETMRYKGVSKPIVNLLKFLNNKLAALATINGMKSLAVSGFIKEQLTSLGMNGNTEVCYPPIRDCGCDTSLQGTIPTDNGTQILTVSRIAAEKGINFLFEVAGLVGKINTGIIFNLVGYPSDNYGKALMKIKPDNVNYLGPKSGAELCDIYSRNIFFSPSPNEALGLVLIEALLHERPAIARCEVANEVLRGENNQIAGWILPNGARSNAEYAAQLVADVLGNKELVNSASNVAQSAMKKFDPKNTKRRFVELVMR